MNLREVLAFLAVPPPPVGLGEKLRAGLSAFLAISLLGYLSSRFLEGAGLTAMIASMGASAVILFAVPHSPMAQPWPMLGGHLISALIGAACARWLPETSLGAGAAVGLAVFAMFLTRSLHPPGGATALVPNLGGSALRDLGFQYVLTPVALNALLLLLLAWALNNGLNGRRYPARLQPKAEPQPGPGDVQPLERLGINAEDLHAALREMQVFMDVSETDLGRIYNAAALHAYRREFGELTCGRVMSRDLVTVSFATELDEAWRLLSLSGVKALPVIDRARYLIGIVTREDFIAAAEPGTYSGFRDRLRRLLARTPTVTSLKPEVVGQIMSAPPVFAVEHAHIAELVPLLSDRGLHQVPIVDAEGRLVGIIAQSDLIAVLYRGAAALRQDSPALSETAAPAMFSGRRA